MYMHAVLIVRVARFSRIEGKTNSNILDDMNEVDERKKEESQKTKHSEIE